MSSTSFNLVMYQLQNLKRGLTSAKFFCRILSNVNRATPMASTQRMAGLGVHLLGISFLRPFGMIGLDHCASPEVLHRRDNRGVHWPRVIDRSPSELLCHTVFFLEPVLEHVYAFIEQGVMISRCRDKKGDSLTDLNTGQ